MLRRTHTHTHAGIVALSSAAPKNPWTSAHLSCDLLPTRRPDCSDYIWMWGNQSTFHVSQKPLSHTHTCIRDPNSVCLSISLCVFSLKLKWNGIRPPRRAELCVCVFACVRAGVCSRNSPSLFLFHKSSFSLRLIFLTTTAMLQTFVRLWNNKE